MDCDLTGYAGDVWYPQPAPKDHPWRSMPRHAMTPHYSGTTLDAQQRYAAGVKEILRRTFDAEPLNETDIIVQARNTCLDLAGNSVAIWQVTGALQLGSSWCIRHVICAFARPLFQAAIACMLVVCIR